MSATAIEFTLSDDEVIRFRTDQMLPADLVATVSAAFKGCDRLALDMHRTYGLISYRASRARSDDDTGWEWVGAPELEGHRCALRDALARTIGCQ